MNQIINPNITAKVLRISLLNTETSLSLPQNIQSADIQSVSVNQSGANSYGVQFEYYFESGTQKTGNRNTIFQASGLNIPLSGYGGKNIYFIGVGATSNSFLDITLYLYA